MNIKSEYECEKEAQVLGRYIIDQEINKQSIQLYKKALEYYQLNNESNMNMYWFNIVINKYWLLPGIDFLTAFVFKKHIIKKKLLILSTILENQPDYYDQFFLTEDIKNKGIYFQKLIFRALYSVLLSPICLLVFLREKYV